MPAIPKFDTRPLERAAAAFATGLILTAALMAAAPVAAAGPGPLDALGFLLGEWTAEPTATPGEPTGASSFAVALQGRVVVRTGYAQYPPKQGRPASRHDDLMVIHAERDGGLRAEYWDSEGHAIRYVVTAVAGSSAVFLSEGDGGPRFRLSYEARPDGRVDGRFEIAPPDKPEAFSPYLAWTMRRALGTTGPTRD